MPNNKKHKMSKIKDVEKAHPYSRKAVQARRALSREEKMVKIKNASDSKKIRIAERIMWFKYALPEELPAATPEVVYDVIEQYIQRNSDEVERIQSTLRKNRPSPPKLDMLQALAKKDEQEYINGIEIPLLLDQKNVTILRAWDGDYNGISRIKMVTVRRPDAPKDTKTSSETVVAQLEAATGMEVDQ
ncbi:translation machinery-associated protein 16 [Phlyctochytrium arcticum]|nr:translation machinery-associated protein 16 [Phlyctochytrium arcticum]